jgi:hypothetical protein
MPDMTLSALSLERRSAALAFFKDMQLEDILIRQLSSDPAKAISSVTEFLNRALERNRIKFVALLQPKSESGERVNELYKMALSAIREAAIPFVEVSEQELFDSYGHPPLRKRQHLRKAGRNIWPALNDIYATRSAVDAAVLGLHVQVEHLFNIQSEQI